MTIALTIKQMERETPDVELPKRKVYERELERLQIEMLKMQLWVKEEGERVAIVFEGRDAAGRGGAIRRFTEHTNPRSVRVVALPKPTDLERSQWYFQRYVTHLPAGGEIVLYDRSWYNRAGVERVMVFATPAHVEQFYEQAPLFEAQLVDSGIRLFKLWFTVSQEEQHRRFEARGRDPLKQWKLSPTDEASIERFAEYGAARDDMVRRTNTPHAPWTVVELEREEARATRGDAPRAATAALPDEGRIGRPSPRPAGRSVSRRAVRAHG